MSSKDDNGTREEHEIPADQKDQATNCIRYLQKLQRKMTSRSWSSFLTKESSRKRKSVWGSGSDLQNLRFIHFSAFQAKKTWGVKRLMEFIINVAPAPDKTIQKLKDGTAVPCDSAAQPSIFIYKTSVEPHLGDVSFFRVMSGKIVEGCDLVIRKTEQKRDLLQFMP